MPTYDYICPKCKKEQEIFHSINDDTKYYCDICGQELKIEFKSTQEIIYKGSGWTKQKKWK